MNIKIIMLAVAGMLYIQPYANAQSGSKFAKNYPVCRDGAEYVICDEAGTVKDNKALSAGRVEEPKRTKVEPACEITQVVYVSSSYKDNPRLKVSYDMPGDVYEGKEVMSNDGVQQNIARNINYLDFSVARPPNDGGNSTK